MDFLYNTGISLYKLGVRAASLKNHKAKQLLEGQARTFSYLKERLSPGTRYIWIHAASLGEFEQGRPLIEMIKAKQPDAHIVLSFLTPSGYEVRKGYNMVDAVVYLPFDLPENVDKFINLVNPQMAIFIKYEFWGNYLKTLKRRGIPTYLVSAIFRPGQVFFKPWGGMFRELLSCFTTMFVQNAASRTLLNKIGFNNVEVAGDTRFDRVADVRNAAKDFPVVERFVSNSKFTLVAGSSWQPDEDIIVPYFNSHPGMKLILAPHEFDKERLDALLAKFKRPVSLYSCASADEMEQCDALVVDCFGILSSLYRYGQVAYVGGGFGAGIHNVNEAAVYGMPVVFGPNHKKFREATDLIACGGGFAIDGDEAFAKVMDKMLSNKAFLEKSGTIADKYIQSHLGATDFVYANIFGKSAGK
ncbi:MAG: glycosyltransferase N-terminal domain-containing protein [Sodaliphilus sp.]|nr:glycosyltransferase N-terminal domain-containing protein [Sodaliphilus sp.]